jgi:hypothetical protein
MKNIFASVISVCMFSAPVFASEFQVGEDSVITHSSSSTSSSSNSSRKSIENLLERLAKEGEPNSFTDTYLSHSQPLPNNDHLIESVTDMMTEDLTLSRKALTIAPRISASIAATAASSAQTTIKRGTSLNLPEPDSSSDDSDSSSDDSSSSSDTDESFGSVSAAAASAYDPSNLSLSLPSRLIFTIACQTFSFTKPDIVQANSLNAAIDLFSAAPVKNTTNGIKALILDVDGTLTTHPEREPSKYLWPLAQREQCVNSVRTIKAQSRVEIFFSSAWRSRDTTDRESIRSTLTLLREVGFTNADLGIKDDDKVIELHIRVRLGTHKRGKKPKTFLIKAFKCGNVVSCSTPNNTDYFFRGKLFAPAIAQPLICSEIEVVGLVDDSKKNAQIFIEDTMFNPYGSNSVTYLPILLSAYKPTDLEDDDEE